MLSTTLQPETHVVSARLDSKLSKLRGAKKLRSGRSSRHVLAERMSESVTLQPCSVPGFLQFVALCRVSDSRCGAWHSVAGPPATTRKPKS